MAKEEAEARDSKKPRKPAVIDPNLPRPDGEHVSPNGGLYFVGVILSLIAFAVVLQFVLGG